MQFSTRDHPAVRAAARHRLAGLTDPPEHVVLCADDVEGVRAFCRTDRLSGLLADAVLDGTIEIDPRTADITATDTNAAARNAGRKANITATDADAAARNAGRTADITATDANAAARNAGRTADITAEIVADWHAALEACVALEALLVRVGTRLDDAEIRWMSTKGPAVAHLDFDDPALRTFGDIDLIVHPDDWSTAVRLLDDDAATRPWFHRYVERFGKGVTLLVDDMEIDLHRRFAVGRFGIRPNMAECFDDTTRFELAGHPIQAPAASTRLLHACTHAALGGETELRAFRDVAQIALGCPEAVDPAWATARRWGIEAVVAAAIIEASVRLGLPDELDVVARARRVAISPRDARVLQLFAGDDDFRHQALTTLGALPWRDRLPYARDLVMMARERRR